MGWTVFACFGYTKKRKRPKRASKFGCKSKRIQGYQTLKSDVPAEVYVSELRSSSNLVLREKPKDEKKARIKKKVRFNLEVNHVITYEPLPSYDASSLQDEDDKNWEQTAENDQQAAAAVCLVSLGKTDSFESTLALLSASHTCSNFFDDEEDNYDDDKDEDEDIDSEISDFNDNNDAIDEAFAEESPDLSYVPLINSVLKPIENLSQWKAIKAKKY